MSEEKSDAISYRLPPQALGDEAAWLDLNKVRILRNKSFLTNLISAVVFGVSYVIPQFTGRNALMLASLLPYRVH